MPVITSTLLEASRQSNGTMAVRVRYQADGGEFEVRYSEVPSGTDLDAMMAEYRDIFLAKLAGA